MNDMCKTCFRYRSSMFECWEKIGERDVCAGYAMRIETASSDPVNSPAHYVGQIECIDYLRDKLTPAEFTGFCMGNVLKYCSRWRKKDGLQDLKKAKVYLDWAIEAEEKHGRKESE